VVNQAVQAVADQTLEVAVVVIVHPLVLHKVILVDLVDDNLTKALVVEAEVPLKTEKTADLILVNLVLQAVMEQQLLFLVLQLLSLVAEAVATLQIPVKVVVVMAVLAEAEVKVRQALQTLEVAVVEEEDLGIKQEQVNQEDLVSLL
jgi:hypothetical protein